jgi:hypothetical protein
LSNYFNHSHHYKIDMKNNSSSSSYFYFSSCEKDDILPVPWLVIRFFDVNNASVAKKKT